MTTLRSRYKTPLGLPGGITVRHEGTEVSDAQMRDIRNSRGAMKWIERGLIEIVGEPEPEPKPETHTVEVREEGDEKDRLITALASHGIEKDRRSGVDTLRALLEEAENADG